MRALLLAASLLLIAPVMVRGHAEIEDALLRLNTLIDATPDDAALYLRRAELHARHENSVPAEANFRRAAQLAPNLPGLERAWGRFLLSAGRPAEAKLHLDRALVLDPDDAEALILRGRCRVQINAHDAAIADYDAALQRIAEPRPELFLERAAAHREPARALQSLNDAIARIGPAITLQLRALDLEEELGRIDAALARLDTILAHSERREIYFKRRGDLLSASGRAAAARSAYASALAAIAALPEWLRATPETRRLADELSRLVALPRPS